MRVLAIDLGGTHVKLLLAGKRAPRKADTGPTVKPRDLVRLVRGLTADWPHDAIALGYPGRVTGGVIGSDPHNLGPGWVGFDFVRAFGCPVRTVNDAAMQALGDYRGGRLLFLGLGTGLGSAMIVEGVLQPMELAHLPYRSGRTFEEYVGVAGLRKLGKKKWRHHVAEVVGKLVAALEPDDVVIGGGNAKKLRELPPLCRLGENAAAFRGGFRLWQAVAARPPRAAKKRDTKS